MNAPASPFTAPLAAPLEFRSDNTGRVAPELIAALAKANDGTALGYGGDAWTTRVQARFSDLFEKDVEVFPVATGTAANAISLAALSPSFGAVYCSVEAHVNTSEANATGFFSGGATFRFMPNQYDKITAGPLDEALTIADGDQTHRSRPAAVTITQATGLGAVYTPDEVAAIGAVARKHEIAFHMDGARFANAVAQLGCSPAEVTWKAGVDVLSFGVTKNGGLLSDAIVVFTPGIAPTLPQHLRRAGQVWSKMRYAAAQLIAYVEDDLWLRNARGANSAAMRIAAGLAGLNRLKLLAPVEANELFLELPAASIDALTADGVMFYRRPGNVVRLVCRFDTTDAECDALVATLKRHLAA